jgi:hypothetical protein
MTINPTPDVNCRYGAPMGRPDHTEDDPALAVLPFTLRRIRINSGGYDSGGAYWGIGTPLYWASNDVVERWFRAPGREAAKNHIRKEFPDAKFCR